MRNLFLSRIVLIYKAQSERIVQYTSVRVDVNTEMMAKLISIVTIIAIASVCVFADEERYSDQYDHINPTDILSNDKLRDQYLKCYMGTGPCVTPDAKFFKGI